MSVVRFRSIEGEYGAVLGYAIGVVASYHVLAAFGILSLLVAIGSAVGFGLCRLGGVFWLTERDLILRRELLFVLVRAMVWTLRFGQAFRVDRGQRCVRLPNSWWDRPSFLVW